VADLRRRLEAAGREPGAVAVGVAGLWPMLDIRRGWDAGELVEAAGAAAAIGVGTLFATVCGDDPLATGETLAALGDH
jgi:hypothetical protein